MTDTPTGASLEDVRASIERLANVVALLAANQKQTTIATIAAAVLSNMGRPVSVQDVVNVVVNVNHGVYPDRASPAYKTWAETQTEFVKRPLT